LQSWASIDDDIQQTPQVDEFKNSYGIINATMNSRAVKIECPRSLHFVANEMFPSEGKEHFMVEKELNDYLTRP